MRVNLTISSEIDEIPRAVEHLTKRIVEILYMSINDLKGIQNRLDNLKKEDKDEIAELVQSYEKFRKKILDAESQAHDIESILAGFYRIEQIILENEEAKEDVSEADGSLSEEV